jgi:hypothetical protein
MIGSAGCLNEPGRDTQITQRPSRNHKDFKRGSRPVKPCNGILLVGIHLLALTPALKTSSWRHWTCTPGSRGSAFLP